MADINTPRPVPVRVRDQVSATLAQLGELPEEVRWQVRRLVGWAYTEGYELGHCDGGWEALNDRGEAATLGRLGATLPT